MQQENFVDPIKFIKKLNKEKIRFLLIGRQALVQYGAPLQSFDYDFYISPDLETLKKIWEIAEHFNMEVDPPEPKKSLKLSLFAQNLKVDIFRAAKYSIDKNTFILFEDMYKNRNEFKGKSGFTISLPTLEDLRKSKLMRNSVKDREDIKYIDILLKNKLLKP